MKPTRKYPLALLAACLLSTAAACAPAESGSASAPAEFGAVATTGGAKTPTSDASSSPGATASAYLIHADETTLAKRFDPPAGFARIQAERDSFAAYLQALPLKPHGAKVALFDGRIKDKSGVYEAVVAMDIGKRDLQQCADAVMRLRAEYLYRKGDFDAIHYNLTNGFRVDYSKWTQGYRVAVTGNKTAWVKKKSSSNTYADFRSYMELVFAYAGSLSLEKELKPVPFGQMQIGDVLIQGGSPGHAVIVVDMAENHDTGEKLYMLAQSYMPAQDIQILSNPNVTRLGPWHVLDDTNQLVLTPEWRFTTGDLRRF